MNIFSRISAFMPNLRNPFFSNRLDTLTYNFSHCFAIRYVLLAVLIILTGFQTILKAQDIDSTLTDTLGQIEVKATPSSISTNQAPMALTYKSRSALELNTNPALTLDRVTYDIPGLWVNNSGNYATGLSMTIRGLGWRAAFGVRGIQILMDGIPLTMADGQSVTNIIDPSFIRHIEVIRGPSSNFWGNSSGGVVYISTQPPANTAPTLRLRTMVGSYGMKKGEIQWSQSFKNSQFSAYSSYMYEDGYRDHSQVKIGRAGLSGTINFSQNSGLKLFGAFVSYPRAYNPGSLTKAQAESDPTQARSYFASNNARESANQGQLGATYFSDTSMGTIKTTAYGIIRDLKNPLPFAYIDLYRKAGGLRFVLENNKSLLNWDVGVEQKYQHDDRVNWNMVNGNRGNQLELDQIETVNNRAAFARARLPVGVIDFNASLRYDWLKFHANDQLLSDGDQSGNRSFTSLSPSFGITYHYPTGRLFANISTAFEAPTTTELVNRPNGGGGYNPNIGPEHTRGLETGVRGLWDRMHLQYDFAFFTMRVQDMLIPYQIPNSDRVYYRNQGETRHRGIESNLEWSPLRKLHVNLSYTFTDATFLDAQTQDGNSLDGNEIPAIPRHRFAGGLEWDQRPLLFSIDAESVNAYQVNNENTTQTDGYLVFNTRLSHHGFKLAPGTKIQPFFSLNNIFDQQYSSSIIVNARGDRYFEPAAGRNWTFGFSLQFK